MKTKRLHKLFVSLIAGGALVAAPLWAIERDDSTQQQQQPGQTYEDEGQIGERERHTPERDRDRDDAGVFDDDTGIFDDDKDREGVATGEADQKKNELLNWIREQGDMNEIASVLEQVDLANILEEGQTYTFFLPNDDAFSEQGELRDPSPAGFGEPEEGERQHRGAADRTTEQKEKHRTAADKSPEQMENILRAHIAEGSYSASELRDRPVTSLSGHEIEVSRDFLMRHEAKVLDSERGEIAEARIVDTDNDVAGYKVHKVDSVWEVEETAMDEPFGAGGGLYDDDDDDHKDRDRDDDDDDNDDEDEDEELPRF